jgi:hypothetical protein
LFNKVICPEAEIVQTVKIENVLGWGLVRIYHIVANKEIEKLDGYVKKVRIWAVSIYLVGITSVILPKILPLENLMQKHLWVLLIESVQRNAAAVLEPILNESFDFAILALVPCKRSC